MGTERTRMGLPEGTARDRDKTGSTQQFRNIPAAKGTIRTTQASSGCGKDEQAQLYSDTNLKLTTRYQQHEVDDTKLSVGSAIQTPSHGTHITLRSGGVTAPLIRRASWTIGTARFGSTRVLSFFGELPGARIPRVIRRVRRWLPVAEAKRARAPSRGRGNFLRLGRRCSWATLWKFVRRSTVALEEWVRVGVCIIWVVAGPRRSALLALVSCSW